MTLPPALALSPKQSMITDGLGMWVTTYSPENIFVICAIVGLCLLPTDSVTLISIFTFRRRCTMSREQDLEDSKKRNNIIYEGTVSCIYRPLKAPCEH